MPDFEVCIVQPCSKIISQSSEIKMQPAVTPKLPAAVEGTTSAADKNFTLEQDCSLAVSQSYFHATLENKDQEILELQQRNTILMSKIDDLKEQLNKDDMDQSEVSQKVCQIQAEISQIKEEREKAASSLAHQQDETGQMKTAIIQLQTQLEDEEKESMEEKTALKNELDQLKKDLKYEKDQAENQLLLFHREMAQNNRLYTSVARKTDNLKVVIYAERLMKEEVEDRLVQQAEETLKLKDAVTKMTKEMEEQKCQFEKEKICLLAQKITTAFNMDAEVREVQRIQKNGLKKWENEKSILMETVSTLIPAINKKEEEVKSCIHDLIDRIHNLEQELDDMKKPKPKKQCALMRFFRRIFGRK